MRRIGEFAGQILPGEVQILVQIQPPLGAIGHIIDDTFVGNVLSGAAFTSITPQFHFCDDDVGDVHYVDYTRV